MGCARSAGGNMNGSAASTSEVCQHCNGHGVIIETDENQVEYEEDCRYCKRYLCEHCGKRTKTFKELINHSCDED